MNADTADKILVATVVLKLVSALIVVYAMLQIAYVGNGIITETCDEETVDLVQAAFYLGGMIGVFAMMAVVLMRSLLNDGIDLCVAGLKWVRDRITGENRKHPTHPDWTAKT